MNTRRSFFRRVGAIVAAVALAPEIAFNRKLDFGWRTSTKGIYEQLAECTPMSEQPLDLQELIKAAYDLMRARRARGEKFMDHYYASTDP